MMTGDAQKVFDEIKAILIRAADRLEQHDFMELAEEADARYEARYLDED